jgi:HigB_toxin, RelE-like toxic component of a toxin-antitoxin system
LEVIFSVLFMTTPGERRLCDAVEPKSKASLPYLQDHRGGHSRGWPASIVPAEREVFNIKGNDYRLVAAIDYEKSIFWIRWVGVHADYDRIDVKEGEHDGRT